MESKQKLFIIIAVALMGLIVVGFIGVKQTSKPEFCSTCHSMQPAFDNWASSAHAEVDCMSCHSEPGFAGFVEVKLGGLKQVAVTLTSDVQPEDVVGLAHVNEERCLSCHEQEATDQVIPHMIHSSQEFGCMDCHDRIVHDPPELAVPDKSQEACIACHRQQ
ncbi:MAG: NapC/NirT family cytochrome c [Bacillota bacterium]|nr:NapC/NirT family cytochrome c [Bacillota bacterium]